MTYIVTNAELFALIGFLNLIPSENSPLNGCSDNDIPDNEQLESRGLLKSTDSGYVVDGVLVRMLHVCCEPCVVVKAECLRSGSALSLCSEDGSVWCGFVYIPYLDSYAITEFPTPEALTEWLSGSFLPDFAPVASENMKTPFVMTFDEWNLFILTQYIFMQRQGAEGRTLSGEDEIITDSDLDKPGVCDYLYENLKKQGFPVYSTRINLLRNPEKRKELCESLCDKDIFIHDESDTGFCYTDRTKMFIDNGRLTECVTVTRNDISGKSYKSLVAVNQTGYTVMLCDDNGIRIIPLNKLPWKTWLNG